MVIWIDEVEKCMKPSRLWNRIKELHILKHIIYERI